MEDSLAPQELLRFLQAEAETLQQLQAKISNELHQLQVEEEVYVRTLDRLNQNDSSNSTNENPAGMQLLEALHQELASAVPPLASVSPSDPTPLAITETDSDKWEVSELADLGDEEEEFELLDALESGDVKL